MFFRLYRVLNLLSIDVAVGAIICAMFFARVFNTVISPYSLVCLGLTVWIIYTADHLLDAYKLKGHASTDRHLFHQQNFGRIFLFLCLALFTDGFLSFFLRTQLLEWGLVLGCAVFIYFLIQSNLRLMKEPSGAILYSTGILLPSLSVHEIAITVFTSLVIIGFVVTALINLILFSWFDLDCDKRDQRASLITAVGSGSGKTLLRGLFISQGLITAGLLFSSTAFSITLVPVLMNLILLGIFIFNEFFSIRDRYRYAGDAVFLLPVLYLIIF